MATTPLASGSATIPANSTGNIAAPTNPAGVKAMTDAKLLPKKLKKKAKKLLKKAKKLRVKAETVGPVEAAEAAQEGGQAHQEGQEAQEAGQEAAQPAARHDVDPLHQHQERSEHGQQRHAQALSA